jgi:excisionase family DNA binding protein
MNAREVAKALGVSESTIYECIRTGRIPSLKLGRRVVIPRIALGRLIEEIANRGAA